MTIEVDRDIMSIDDILDVMYRRGHFKHSLVANKGSIREVEVGYVSGQYLRVMRGISVQGVKAKLAADFYHTLSRKCISKS